MSRDGRGPGRHDVDGSDDVARRLRAALSREADMVRPSADGLARITGQLDTTRDAVSDVSGAGDGRGRPGGRRGPGWVPWVAGLAAAAVVGVVAGVAVLGADGPPPAPVSSPTQPAPSVPPPTAASPTDTSPTGTPSATEPATPSDPASPTTVTPPPAGSLEQVPVYWVGSTAAGTWLYREFRTVPDSGGVLTSAVRAAMALTPLDPDYSTPWRQPSRLDVSRDGDAITIDVSADAFASTSVGSELADRAVQQLVWTATAAAQSSGPVTVLVDGAPADAWGAVALGEPMSRDAGARAPLWLDGPPEGAVVPAGDVTVTGQADVFEGNVVWEVRDGSGTVVADGFTTAAMGEFVPFEFTVPLTPGNYSVSVHSPDVSDGESPEGPRMFEQDRAFVVR